MSYEKPLPASIHAERAVLGSILQASEAIVAIAPLLAAEDFMLERHALIYAACLACYQRRTPPDIVNVAEELRRQELLEDLGGVAELADLATEVPAAVYGEHYAHIVAQTALFRRLIEAGGRIAALGYDETDDIETTLERAEQILTSIRPPRTRAGLQSAAAILPEYLELLQQADDGRVGLPTGYLDLDRVLGGLLPKQLIVLGGRPGQGKTALALSIAYRLLTAGYAVDVFSLEMSREEVIGRLIGYHCTIGTDRQLSGDLSDAERARVLEAAGAIHEWPLRIDDTQGSRMTSLLSSVRQACIERVPDLVIVDYLQLIGSDSPNRNRTQVVDEISRGLKHLAGELRRPVLALAAISRAVEGRQSKIPTLADLRESGSIEADADKVLFVYRDDAYDKTSERAGTIEVHVVKHRNGPTDIVPLQFNHGLAYVQDLATYHAPEGY